jgi:hypothetical protein
MNTWEELHRYLPKGWEEAAREQKALERSRSVKTADDLLALNLMYLTEGGSYQATSSMMAMTTDIHLNKNAVRKRIQKSWQWLRWMAERLCRTQGYAMEKPEWLTGRRVVLVDGTDMVLQGSKGSDYRLHYAFDLFGYHCEQMELTTAKEGEKLTRYKVKAEDIIIADRGYGTIRGMEHVRAGGGNYILRLKAGAFALYDAQGKRIDLLSILRPLKPVENESIACFYQTSDGSKEAVRIVAMRKDEASAAAASRALDRQVSRHQYAPVRKETRQASQYIVLATNLTEDTARVLELYRARWQIEQVFHRLKGLFAFGEVPGSNPDSVKAWFYGKLFLAALCETMVKHAAFPPEG